jgi:hypothetical protein
MPAPLIEFSKFAQPQQWLLRRREPPWLEDERWPVRAFRVTLALGLMGAASGWVTVGGLTVQNALEPLIGNTNAELGLLIGPGFWFGMMVLVPLSRCLGRGWIMTLFAVPVSMFASYAGVMTLVFVSPILRATPGWIPGGRNAAGFYAGLVGAGLLGVWMGHFRHFSAWLAGAAAALLAGTACGLYFAMQPEWIVSIVPRRIGEILTVGLLYVSFQSLTAAGLGVRLWWPANETREGGS